MSTSERIFCVYCKKAIEVLLNDSQICPNCAEILKVPHAELFNGVFVLEDEVIALKELEKYLTEKILFKGLHEITKNDFEVNEEHSIISLRLNFNNLTELPNLFNAFTNLKELKLTSRSLSSLPSPFCPPSLQELSLFSCDFTEFPHALFNCSLLENLWVSGTKITSIPAEITILQNLVSLKLNNNKIKSIHDNIQTLTNLSVLDLGCNFIDDLPKSVCSLHNLTVLKMHVNNLKELPKEILELVNLQILDLYCNFLKKIPSLPSSIQYLDLSSNFNLELSENLEEFKNLKMLNIGGNTKINIKDLKKIIKESSLVTKLNILAPNRDLLE